MERSAVSENLYLCRFVPLIGAHERYKAGKWCYSTTATLVQFLGLFMQVKSQKCRDHSLLSAAFLVPGWRHTATSRPE